jgi:hypothetical protein
MRRILVLLAILAGVVGVTAPAWAEPPAHIGDVTKNNVVTILPLPQCPAGGATSIDLVFTESFHAVFTSTTFHITDTQTGTFTTRGPNGEALVTGHFVNTMNHQGPGFPSEVFTGLINATGKASDGSRTQVHVLTHLTITPDGQPVVAFQRVNC